ncbi:hypothetical protein PTQ27_07770 [Mannheimia sp. AT1]|uniref:Uncharacterized protein n=1 Tax=Mannheimia cairinae TaxID=3025936 RepID=A0ABT5MQ99_9PAST|nr:hypothetical protein [Mannheimia cairinae]MDD0824358.1 hypothetical protein [Mannheimia cairinae]MDD0826519.1 hypothetical protein [Mannheimia cairinae]
MKAEITELNNQNSQYEDPIELSKSNLLVIVFAKTKSPYFKMALSIASGALKFSSYELDKDTIYTSVFGRTPEQAARALLLLRYVDGWTTKQIFIAGRLYTGSGYYSLGSILECYQSACQCLNAKSHCLSLTNKLFKDAYYRTQSIYLVLSDSDRPKEQPEKSYVIPCKKLENHPIERGEYFGSWKEQIQALAVENNVDWCPLFNLDYFRQYE